MGSWRKAPAGRLTQSFFADEPQSDSLFSAGHRTGFSFWQMLSRKQFLMAGGEEIPIMLDRVLIFEHVNKHVKVSTSTRSLMTYTMDCC